MSDTNLQIITYFYLKHFNRFGNITDVVLSVFKTNKSPLSTVFAISLNLIGFVVDASACPDILFDSFLSCVRSKN